MGLAMPELEHILFTFLGVLTLTILVDGQSQSGFTSLDCGISVDSTYTDVKTILDYVSDESFINAGVGKAISPGYNTSTLARQLWYVRTFPTGDRNCYNTPVTINTKYLIRTTFYYGNYDRLNKRPTFDLHLGVNKWVTVEIDDVASTLTREIIYTATMDYIYVCLVNTGKGTPFLNALEFRPLPDNAYNVPAGALALYSRLDRGSISNDSVRYPDDAYDRIWKPNHLYQCTEISTNLTIDAQSQNDYQPPSLVMRSASTPTDASHPMHFYIEPEDSTLVFYVYMHFAEIVMLGPKQTRIFNISVNNKIWYGPVTLDYLSTTTIFSNQPSTGYRWRYEFSLFKVDGSTLPPIQNAIEYYYLVNLDQLQTDQADVDAITNVKSTYGIARNWQGDPCAPKNYSWDGLKCSYPDGAQPKIIALSLSSSGLVGSISPGIGNLQSLESLDLSNNSFTGSVPSFLSKLTSLKVLNLSGNNLTGSVPVDLYQRSQNGLLQISVSGNPNLCLSDSCTPTKVEKKTSIVAPVVASIAGVLVLATALATILICLRRRKKSVSQGGNAKITSRRSHEPFDAKKRQFTYSELRQMTNNFNKVLGKGGFGIVYYGYLDGTPVAVKILSENSVQGFKEFQAEVKLLLRVHHKNLTSLVGYCDEDPKLGLIYEYMANGNIKDHLSEKNSNTLSLERRLQVAVEAAQGLEYLHKGCKPPIVHRDVKTTNILLNDKFQAKLADFGLSRVVPTESGTQVSTTLAGTTGYLDPECYAFTERSDVYSFGVVLLEIITGRSVIDKAQQYGHIGEWVSFQVEKGDINQVVDPRLRGEFNINSVWKVVELALSCLLPSERRPTMSQVVIELNEALAMEMARTREGFSTQTRESIGVIQDHSTILPAAR